MKPSLLFIDDSEMMCQFLVQYFGSRYRVKAFPRAKLAWQWLNEGHLPDLIILDLILPETKGFDLLIQLKASAFFSDIPVIILSSIDTSDQRVKCLQAGAVDYLIKPFNPEELECRVRFQLQMNSTGKKQGVMW